MDWPNHLLSSRCGWNLDVAGPADHVPGATERAGFVEIDPRPSERVLRPAPAAGDGDDRRLPLPGHVSLLRVLGSHADPDGAADWHVRTRAPGLRRGEILPVHDGRFGLHAGSD